MLHYDLNEIVKCKHCGQKEYWGHMIWLDGSVYCRDCYTQLTEDREYPYSANDRVALCR